MSCGSLPRNSRRGFVQRRPLRERTIDAESPLSKTSAMLPRGPWANVRSNGLSRNSVRSAPSRPLERSRRT